MELTQSLIDQRTEDGLDRLDAPQDIPNARQQRELLSEHLKRNPRYVSNRVEQPMYIYCLVK